MKTTTALLDFLRNNSKKTWFGLAVALCMSALTVVLPIYLGGFRQTVDMQSHLHFVQAFEAAIRSGDLYPGWANDNLGFGSIGIRFYPPATAFFTALLHLITGDWYAAFSLSMFAWMVLGCLGMYLLVREWSTPALGVLAAMLFAVVPYHIAQIYRFFLYAEFAAMSVIPFCLLYLTRLCRRGNWSDVVLLGASYSVLVLTHIPVTIMLTISLLVFVPFVIDWAKWRLVLRQLACAAIITAVSSSFYWIRVVTELSWVAHAESKYTVAGYQHGAMLFPFMLVDYDSTYEFPIFRHLDILTVLTVVLLIPSIVFFLTRHRSRNTHAARVVAATSLAGAFGLFLLSKPSQILWSNLNLLQRIQYPWRWLSVLSALAVLSVTLSLGLLVEAGRVPLRRVWFGAILLVVAFAAVDIRQIRGTGSRILRTEFNELARDMRSESVAEHWWPIWAKSAAFDDRERVTAGTRGVEINEWDAERRTFTVGEGDPGDVRVATFYYPYWTAAVEGRDLDVRSDPDGVIILPVDAERSKVTLRFQEPGLNGLVSWISVAAWLFILGFLVIRFAKKQ